MKINIIYGENDDLVDYADIMRFVSLSPAISLLTLQEEGHRFTTPASQERTIEWFLSGLKELRE